MLHFDFTWTHIGNGPLKNELEHLASTLIPGKFGFMGTLKNEQVLDYLARVPVDVFINVSKSEGIPVSIMEAMSFGIPCIATAVGGTPEIVNDDNGFLLPTAPTLDDISKAIADYYNINIKQTKESLAYHTWNDKYCAEKNYKNFINQILIR